MAETEFEEFDIGVKTQAPEFEEFDIAPQAEQIEEFDIQSPIGRVMGVGVLSELPTQELAAPGLSSGFVPAFQSKAAESTLDVVSATAGLLDPQTRQGRYQRALRRLETARASQDRGDIFNAQDDVDEAKAELERLGPSPPTALTEVSKTARDAAGTAFEFYQADPQAKNLAAQVGRGSGAFAALLPTILSGPLGLPAGAAQMAGQTYSSTYRDTENQLRQAGETDEQKIEDQASAAATTETVKVAPALGAYVLGGKLASGLTSKLIAESAPAVVKGVAGITAATGANVLTGTALRAIEGEDWRPTIETLTMDTLFGLLQHRDATNTAKRRISEEVARREAMMTPDQVAESRRLQAEQQAQQTQAVEAGNVSAARLGTERQAQGVAAGSTVTPEALAPEIQARAEGGQPPIVSGAPVPSAPQQKEQEVAVNEEGFLVDENGNVVTVDDSGVKQLVEGSPEQISAKVLIPEPPKGEPSATEIQQVQEGLQAQPEGGTARGEKQGAGAGDSLQRGAEGGGEGVVAAQAPAKAQPEVTPGQPIIIGTALEGGITGRSATEPHLGIIMEDLPGRSHLQGKEGFMIVDAEGNFKWVDRLEAGNIARESGLLPNLPEGTKLTSEMLRGEVKGMEPPTKEGLARLNEAFEAYQQAKAAAPAETETQAAPKVEEPAGPPPIEPPAAPPGVTPEGAPQPLPSPTSIRNVTVDANRVAQGLPPRMEPLRRTFGTAWEEAMAKVEENPNAASQLIAEINRKPRALQDWESALIAHEQVTRENAYNKALDEVNNATTEADRLAAEERLTVARDMNQEIYDAGQLAGTQSGQSLAARKMLVNRDYSLARMEAELTGLLGGPKATPQQKSKAQTDAKESFTKIKTAEEKATKADEKQSVVVASEEYNKIVKAAQKELRQAKRAGKSILETVISKGEEAQERIRKRNIERSQGGVTMQFLPFDLRDFPDHVLVGAGYIAKGIKGIGEFTKKLTADFGPDAEPHAQRIFEAANEHLNQVTRGSTKTVEEALAKDKAGALNPTVVYEVARAHVNEGVEGFDNVMRATTESIQKLHPEASERAVRDAFSGYGKVTRPSQEADRVKLREYRRIGQLQSAIDDALKKIAPMKSGAQRDKATADVRAKMAELKRAMEENGIEVTSPEQQLATAEKAAVTRLTNRKEDIQRQINAKKRDEVSKGRKVDSPEIKRLRAEVEDLNKILDQVAPATAGVRSEAAALKAVQKSIYLMDQELKTGVRVMKEAGVLTSQKLQDLRAERDSMRDLLKSVREDGKVKRTPEEIALNRYKKSLETRTKAVRDRIAKGDYEKRTRKETELDKEALTARFEYQKAKDAYEQKAFEYDLSRRGFWKKSLDATQDFLNTSRAIMTSFDVSAPMRQGAFITLAHPIRSLKSFPDMFRAFGSEKAAMKVQESFSDPAQRKNAGLYRQSGLDLTEVGENVTRRKMEEAYQTRWARKIPIVAGSGRAYTIFLNKLRADSFDTMVETLGRSGKVTDVEAKAIANFINVATGRGKFGQKLEQSTLLLNSVFFAPKYVASRFQLIAGQPFYGGNARTRKLIAKEYAKFLIGAGLVTGLAQLGGAKTEDDINSPDFGKLVFGKTHYDFMGGLSGATAFTAKNLATAGGALKAGVVPSYRKKFMKERGSKFIPMWGKYARQKFSPGFGLPFDVLSGKDVVGRPVTPAGAVVERVIPMSFGDVYDAIKEYGATEGIAKSLVSQFGVSAATYDKNKKEKVAKEPWEVVGGWFRGKM